MVETVQDVNFSEILNYFEQFDIENFNKLYSNSVQNVMDQLKEKSDEDFQICMQQLYKILQPKIYALINERIFCKIAYKLVHNEPFDVLEIYKQDCEDFQRENQDFFTMMMKTI